MKNEEFGLDRQIQKRIETALHRVMDSQKRYAGMTYEQGVRDALEWLLDNGENPSLEY